jgi:hypothetical protein
VVRLLKRQVVETIEAKTIQVYAKPSDCGVYSLLDRDGRQLHEVDGYVPRWFPGDNYGDYIILNIDIDTGQILNWQPPTAAQLERWMDENP